jgi:hypothetical protein
VVLGLRLVILRDYRIRHVARDCVSTSRDEHRVSLT